VEGSVLVELRDQSCPIVELRRYELKPRARETLIELFEREFVESQEEAGMRLLGQFRDLDDPDCFVWLRGFSDMETRRRGLEDFYGGPVWRAHAAAANATMVNVDNVLLLRTLSGKTASPDDRPPPGSTEDQQGLLGVTIYPLAESDVHSFPAFFRAVVEPALREAGVAVLATYETEHSENTFPALPVRDGSFFVWMTMFADEADHARRMAEVEQSAAWQDVAHALDDRLAAQPELLMLTPTARSSLHA
jgi:hypothetical protein